MVANSRLSLNVRAQSISETSSHKTGNHLKEHFDCKYDVKCESMI